MFTRTMSIVLVCSILSLESAPYSDVFSETIAAPRNVPEGRGGETNTETRRAFLKGSAEVFQRGVSSGSEFISRRGFLVAVLFGIGDLLTRIIHRMSLPSGEYTVVDLWGNREKMIISGTKEGSWDDVRIFKSGRIGRWETIQIEFENLDPVNLSDSWINIDFYNKDGALLHQEKAYSMNRDGNKINVEVNDLQKGSVNFDKILIYLGEKIDPRKKLEDIRYLTVTGVRIVGSSPRRLPLLTKTIRDTVGVIIGGGIIYQFLRWYSAGRERQKEKIAKARVMNLHLNKLQHHLPHHLPRKL